MLSISQVPPKDSCEYLKIEEGDGSRSLLMLTTSGLSVYGDMTTLCKMFCPEDLDKEMSKLRASTILKDSEQFGSERLLRSEGQEGQEEEEEEEEEVEEPVE